MSHKTTKKHKRIQAKLTRGTKLTEKVLILPVRSTITRLGTHIWWVGPISTAVRPHDKWAGEVVSTLSAVHSKTHCTALHYTVVEVEAVAEWEGYQLVVTLTLTDIVCRLRGRTCGTRYTKLKQEVNGYTTVQTVSVDKTAECDFSFFKSFYLKILIVS